jgi:hypothetical protein
MLRFQIGRRNRLDRYGDETAGLLASKEMQVTYTFSSAPDMPLELPAGYAEKLEKFKRALRGQL